MNTLLRNILLVEDTNINRKVIEVLLKKLGFSTESVENGQEAVNAITKYGKKPQLILMDIQMPIMDGFAATAHIRQWEKENHLPRIPIIALTAGTSAEDQQQALDVGMDDMIFKPINQNGLMAILNKWLAI